MLCVGSISLGMFLASLGMYFLHPYAGEETDTLDRAELFLGTKNYTKTWVVWPDTRSPTRDAFLTKRAQGSVKVLEGTQNRGRGYLQGHWEYHANGKYAIEVDIKTFEQILYSIQGY